MHNKSTEILPFQTQSRPVGEAGGLILAEILIQFSPAKGSMERSYH